MQLPIYKITLFISLNKAQFIFDSTIWHENKFLPSLLPVFKNGMPQGYAYAVSSEVSVLSCIVTPFQSPEGEKEDQEKHLTGPHVLEENYKSGVKHHIRTSKILIECL